MTTYRTTSEVVKLRVPARRLESFCHSKLYGNWQSYRASARTNLLRLSVPEIIAIYNSELRGLANYYLLAGNMKASMSRLIHIGHDSMLRTLSAKLKITKREIIERLRTDDDEWVWTEKARSGRKYHFKVFKLKHLPNAKRHEEVKELATQYDPDVILPTASVRTMVTELVARLDTNISEACGTEGPCEIHHVRKLQDIKDRKPKSLWDMMLSARNQKTLALCPTCHHQLPIGKLPATETMH
jgi:hypothetical protein